MSRVREGLVGANSFARGCSADAAVRMNSDLQADKGCAGANSFARRQLQPPWSE